jgi:hypothetical protein
VQQLDQHLLQVCGVDQGRAVLGRKDGDQALPVGEMCSLLLGNLADQRYEVAELAAHRQPIEPQPRHIEQIGHQLL